MNGGSRQGSGVETHTEVTGNPGQPPVPGPEPAVTASNRLITATACLIVARAGDSDSVVRTPRMARHRPSPAGIGQRRLRRYTRG